VTTSDEKNHGLETSAIMMNRRRMFTKTSSLILQGQLKLLYCIEEHYNLNQDEDANDNFSGFVTNFHND
jgi:hypothetical protein